MIVGLTGLKNVGKDVAADHLVSLGFHKFSFGDAIYDELAINFNVTQAFLRARSTKNTPHAHLALKNCADPEFVRHIVAMEMGLPPGCDGGVRPLCEEALNKPRDSNWLAQRWATEYRRHFYGNDYWTKIVDTRVAELPRGAHVVLADMRHDPEMVVFDTYRAHHSSRINVGGVESPLFASGGILELTRAGTVHTGHSSDNGLDRGYITATYANDGSLAALCAAVEQFALKGTKCL